MHFFLPERPTKAHGWYQALLPFLLSLDIRTYVCTPVAVRSAPVQKHVCDWQSYT
jgi:hypothetical protein